MDEDEEMKDNHGPQRYGIDLELDVVRVRCEINCRHFLLVRVTIGR